MYILEQKISSVFFCGAKCWIAEANLLIMLLLTSSKISKGVEMKGCFALPNFVCQGFLRHSQ